LIYYFIKPWIGGDAKVKKKEVSDPAFEAMFRKAVIENFYEELNSLLSDEELPDYIWEHCLGRGFEK